MSWRFLAVLLPLLSALAPLAADGIVLIQVSPTPAPTLTDARREELARKYGGKPVGKIEVKAWKPGASSSAIPPVPTPRTTFTEGSKRPELVYPPKGELSGADYEVYRRRVYDAFVVEAGAYNAWLKTRPTPVAVRKSSLSSMTCAEALAAWGQGKSGLTVRCEGESRDIKKLHAIAQNEEKWATFQHTVSPKRGEHIKALKGLGEEAKKSPAYARLMREFEPSAVGGGSSGTSSYSAADAIRNTNDYYERQRKHDEELHRQQMQRQHDGLNRALDKAIDRR